MDLRELMQSPALALEPAPTLDTVVRREARALRRRRRALGAALAVVGLAGAVGVVPALVSRDEPAQVAGFPSEDYGIKGATSGVVLLEKLNGAAVVAYYEGNELCIAPIRVKRTRTCAPAVNPATTAVFPHVFGLDAARVDDRRLLVGQAGRGVVDIRVDIEGQPPLIATQVSGRGFALPVFYAEIPKGAVVTGIRGFALDGREIGRRDL